MHRFKFKMALKLDGNLFLQLLHFLDHIIINRGFNMKGYINLRLELLHGELDGIHFRNRRMVRNDIFDQIEINIRRYIDGLPVEIRLDNGRFPQLHPIFRKYIKSLLDDSSEKILFHLPIWDGHQMFPLGETDKLGQFDFIF